jgi:hypothetical protein
MKLYLLFAFGGHELNHVIGLNHASADLITAYVNWSYSPVNFLKFLRPNSEPIGAKRVCRFGHDRKNGSSR